LAVHFDPTLIDNAVEACKCLDECGLGRMKHPPYNPYLASCDFFLFGYFKEKFAGWTSPELKDNFQAVDEI
jgi:hypothetical protein